MQKNLAFQVHPLIVIIAVHAIIMNTYNCGCVQNVVYCDLWLPAFIIVIVLKINFGHRAIKSRTKLIIAT